MTDTRRHRPRRPRRRRPDWIDHAIAGSDRPARLSMLRADAERGTRTVLVGFPDGWRRDADGAPARR